MNVLLTQQKILSELQEIKNLLATQKQVLTLEEFCTYTGLSKHQVYHLTSAGKIKHYRPFGKLLFFDRTEVEEVLKQNGAATNMTISKKVNQSFLKQL